MNALLTTYPRTGQHILAANLKHSLDLELDRSHGMFITKDHDLKITIVRDPIDSITSWVCMELHYTDLSPTRKPQPVDFYIKAAITNFIMFHNYALKNVDIFIKYEDVVNNMDKIINYLSKTYGINKTNDLMDHKIISDPSERHIATSKSYVNYDDVFKKVLHSKEHGELGSSKVMEYYNLCLEKCIVLT